MAYDDETMPQGSLEYSRDDDVDAQGNVLPVKEHDRSRSRELPPMKVSKPKGILKPEKNIDLWCFFT